MTQCPSIFPARGNWSGRLDLIAGASHQSRRRVLKAQTMNAQMSEVMAKDSWQTCRDQEKTSPYAPHPTWTYIQRYGARPMEQQAVTVPGPQPQRGSPAATGKAIQEEKRRQQANGHI